MGNNLEQGVSQSKDDARATNTIGSSSTTPELHGQQKIQNIKTGDSNKKKRSPNWLPQEEEQLACSWLVVSQRPEFITNQTSESFFRAVELDFNQHSKLHHRDHDQIRIRWAALNTSTLKFSAIYNALEKSPPKDSTPEDWMATARKIYSEQSRGHTFKDELAWKKLRHAPKWKQDNKKLNYHQVLMPDLSVDVHQQHQHQRLQAIGQQEQTLNQHHQQLHQLLQQPQDQLLPPPQQQQQQQQQQHQQAECSSTSTQHHSPRSDSPLTQTIEGSRSKRLRLDQDLERLIAQTTGHDSSHSIPVIPTDPLEKRQPDPSNENNEDQDQLDLNTFDSLDDQGHQSQRLVAQNLQLERELKRSQIEMNNLKLLMQSEADCPDQESVILLRLMKSRLKKRLLLDQEN
ncbi:hypothetical protein PGT21_050249 [Puccinia graminis f. sp. tritici]|uniref:No apical meristem-associated C-terminal domain-containing protein n=1 Tax=Puccinia graminis f. sp. tritici TaxID=56615 RepID=A0A5B0MIV0_PUCGR|nr:hypothetical protein PGTUg99_050006 [Puccinia graminis f. sp. tritici]KAA1091538.1 hypothetical protein PGT21_050249 [Puccinia graminis f. sp. tritici]